MRKTQRPTHISRGGTPSLCEVRADSLRAGGWSELSPRCVGAAARRAGLSPLFCDAPISRRPVCFLMHTLPPFGPAELGGFFLEFLRTDSEFGASRPLRERIRGHRGSISLRSFFLKTLSLDSAAQAKNFFVFGCGWWYDREIVLLPPLCEYRERLRERLPGNSASGPHSSRRVQAPSRP